MTENEAKFEHEIKLKQLEIDKLKIERDLHNKLNEINDLSNNISSVSSEIEIAVRSKKAKALVKDELSGNHNFDIEKAKSYEPIKYPNQIFLNIILLLITGLVFYVLPWGQFDSQVNTQFGNQSYLSGKFTGFNLGLFTFSIPLTIINILTFFFIVRNNLKSVGIMAIIGLIVSFFALINITQVEELKSSFSGSFGNVSSGLETTAWAKGFPLCYIIILLLNINKTKSRVESNSEFTDIIKQEEILSNIATVDYNRHEPSVPMLLLLPIIFSVVIAGGLVYYYSRQINTKEVGELKQINPISIVGTDSLEAQIDTSLTDFLARSKSNPTDTLKNDISSNNPDLYSPEIEPIDADLLNGEPNSLLWSGQKSFVDEGEYWRLIIVIKGDKIKIYTLPGKNNTSHPDKGKVTSIDEATIINNTIHSLGHDNGVRLKNAYRYLKGIFYQMNNEGMYNEYKEVN